MNDGTSNGVMPKGFFPSYSSKLAKTESEVEIPTLAKPNDLPKVPKITKSAKAIAYMQEHNGKATKAELREVLCIGNEDNPMSWLRDAVRNGLCHRTDTGFALGPEPQDGPDFDPQAVPKMPKELVHPAEIPTPLSKSALNKQVEGNHYKDLAIQPIEYIHANQIPFAEGSIIKYVSRWRAKGGIKDLEKAKHFIELLIELESKKCT